jgi:hypothetical protein
MVAFFYALPYVLILAQAAWPLVWAYRYASRGCVTSKWVLVLVAALPIPSLVAGFALFAFVNDASVSAGHRAPFVTLMLAALAFYVFGIFNAFVGYWSGSAKFAGRRSK